MEQEKINHFDILPDELLESIFLFSGSLSRFVLFCVSKKFQNFIDNNKENKNNICDLAEDKDLFNILNWARNIGCPYFFFKIQRLTEMTVCSYREIDFSKALFSKKIDCGGGFQENKIGFNKPNTNRITKMCVKSQYIKLFGGGIPRTGNFIINDKQRALINLNLDLNQEACVKLKKYVNIVDDWANSISTRKKLFGEMYDKYQFMPSIKKNEHGKMEFIKFKFNVTMSGDQCINKTIINKIDNNTKQNINAKTITDIANVIGFGTSINLLFDCDHILSIKNLANSHARNNRYGIGFTIYEINYIPAKPSGRNFVLDFISESDSEEEITITCQ